MTSNDDDWDDGSPVKESPPDYRGEARGGEYKPRQSDRKRDYDNRGNNSASHYEKRDNYQGRQNEQREYGQSRNHEFSEEMEIRSNHVGRVIGRSGANIKRIQSEFNVHINIDKRSNMLTVSGSSHETIADAMADIKNTLSDDRDHRQGDGNHRQYGRDDNQSTGRHDSQHQYRSDRNESSQSYQWQEKRETADNEFTFVDWNKAYEISDKAQIARWANVVPLKKDFYIENPEVAQLSAEKVEELRKNNNNVTVARVFEQADGGPDNIPNPIWKFEQCFADYPDLLEEITKQKFETPSPIQCQAWPILLKGEDLIGIAQTGTGKTLAFLLPAMIHTDGQSTPRSERNGPNVLIMAPTRELALQIEKEVNKYSFRNMRAVCVYGGGDRRDQIANVESGVEIIICTPGRLNDLIQAKVVNVESVTYLVLDEADRMLDMGFEPQIRKVLLDIRPDRQTVMTSATWPPGVRRLAQSYMQNPIQVCVGSLDLAATQTVKQTIEIVDEGDKPFLIRKFIKAMKPDDKIIIFMGKKSRANDLSSDLTLEGFLCSAMHGSIEQRDREQAIADISSGEIRILIATDVASRGLDIEDITHVINYDFPRNIEEYVHRVGRTGRAGRTGTSISFVTRSDWSVARELIDILEKGDQEVPDELRQMADRFASAKVRQAAEGRRGGRGRGGGGGGGGGGYRNYHF